MQLRTQFVAGLYLSMVMTVVIGATLSYSIRHVNGLIERSHASGEIVKVISDLRSLGFDYLTHRQERARIQWNAKLGALSSLLESKESTAGEESSYLERIASQSRMLQGLLLQLSKGEGMEPKRGESDEREARLSNRLIAISQDMAQDANQMVLAGQKSIEEAQRRATAAVMICSLVLAVLVLANWLMIRQRVLTPITTLQQATQVIAAGNLNSRIGLSTHDEFGKLAGSFDRMTESLKISRTALESEIAERQRTEEELQQTAVELKRSNDELAQFAYVASHDLQEPLRMVVSYLQLLERRYKGRLDADADTFINFAVDGAHRMRQIIGDILDFSRVGTRGKPFEAVACGELMKVVLANLKASIDQTGAVITCESLPAVTGDPSQLSQLFQNLIGNAVKFHGERAPQIRVAAQRQDDAWCFSVADNGIGIAPEYLERIFVIFQRLHTRREYPGTGIGLAICKKIVERHGGRIWVESEPSQGSTFYFTIPDQGGNTT